MQVALKLDFAGGNTLPGEKIDEENISLFFGPPGTRNKKARNQLRQWARADLVHALYALKVFPANIINSILGGFKK